MQLPAAEGLQPPTAEAAQPSTAAAPQPSTSDRDQEGVIFVLENASLETGKVGKVCLRYLHYTWAAAAILLPSWLSAALSTRVAQNETSLPPVAGPHTAL